MLTTCVEQMPEATGTAVVERARLLLGGAGLA
jgi:hypothetical protein